MTTSGSVNFSVTRDQIIRAALLSIVAMPRNNTLSPQLVSDASQALNMMIKAWQGKDIGLWLNYKVILALAYQTQSYLLGATGTHCSASMGNTALGADAASGAGTITVTSISGISSGDYIGIELDDGTMQWTTVNGAPGGTTVTLSAVLTDDAATDNVVYFYTTKTHRPLEIYPDIRLVNTDGNETPIRLVSRNEYMALTLKSSLGKVSMAYYDPLTGNGNLYLWPTCEDVSDRVYMTIKRPVEDFDSGTDTPDFPQEWFAALKWNLALELASGEYPVSDIIYNRVRARATETMEWAENFDVESTSVYFVPRINR